MTSNINIEVSLDDDKMPSEIKFTAPGGGINDPHTVKAMLLGLWDGEEKSALRIDLWTEKMTVSEMSDFYYQTFFGMADTYLRATKNTALSNDLKAFAKTFLQKAGEELVEDIKK